MSADIDPETAELFARRWQGLTTAEEEGRLEVWLSGAPERRDLARLLHEAWRIAGSTVIEGDSSAFQARMRGAITALRAREDRPRVFFPGSGSRRWPIVLAAMVVLAIGAGYLTWAARSRSEETLATTEAPAREYRTRTGERLSFALSDGTRIVLAPASRLLVRRGPSDRAREVSLEGEAFFDVRHDANRPFVVRTTTTMTEDLGTVFVVREYPGDTIARVIVKEGRVALRAAADGPAGLRAELEAGQLGEIAHGTTLRHADRVDVDRFFAWAEGRLVFEDTPLRDALPQLARWYGLEFRLADSSLGDWPLTATFHSEPSRQVVQMLSASLGLRAEWRDHVVVLARSSRRP